MTIETTCPECGHFFQGEIVSESVACPNCHFAFRPSTAVGEFDELLDLQSTEDLPEESDVFMSDELGLGPIGTFDADDDSLWAPQDETTDASNAMAESAKALLHAARVEQDNQSRPRQKETVFDQLLGQSSVNSRHFVTVLAGVGILFTGLSGLAGVAGHFTKGRMGAFLPMTLLAVAGVGVCVIVYGIGRGLIEMVHAIWQRARRK